MIEVLQNWQEVEEAKRFLENQGLPVHITIQKNWDQCLLYQVLRTRFQQAQFPSIQMLDLGCGDCCTLDFLAALNIKKLHGIDLQIKNSSENLPYELYEGDMTATSFSDQFYDVAVSISVIEHGMNLDALFKEANRILKPDGLLFITTDYWETEIPIDDSIKPFGLTWNIFSKPEIEMLITIAHQYGFALAQTADMPVCSETTVSWYDKHYTFIALLFIKQV